MLLRKSSSSPVRSSERKKHEGLMLRHQPLQLVKKVPWGTFLQAEDRQNRMKKLHAIYRKSEKIQCFFLAEIQLRRVLPPQAPPLLCNLSCWHYSFFTDCKGLMLWHQSLDSIIDFSDVLYHASACAFVMLFITISTSTVMSTPVAIHTTAFCTKPAMMKFTKLMSATVIAYGS